MATLSITGGVPLRGTVQISGAKNAASKMIIASLLTSKKVTLHNIPLNQESDIALELVRMVGASAELTDHTASLEAARVTSASTLAQSRKNRLSILMAAPLLHRVGEAHIIRVEGDKIGPRPVNFHTDALQKMGAKIQDTVDGWHISVKEKLRGISVELPYPSVGATETILFAAVLAEGRTVIRNAAIEPEIQELIMMLQKMGAIIELQAGRVIEVVGVSELHGCEHTVLPDRLEVASYACLALATRGEIHCKGAQHRDVVTFLNAVRQLGGDFEVKEDGITFIGRPTYKALNITTDTFPGFSTDWQQPFVVLMTQAQGISKMHETVYSDRFKYIEALNFMGADIKIAYLPDEVKGTFQLQNYAQSALVKGPTRLKASHMTVPDIRAGLAYVVAACVAEGTSTLDGLEHLERGYENLVGKLRAVGAQIHLVE